MECGSSLFQNPYRCNGFQLGVCIHDRYRSMMDFLSALEQVVEPEEYDIDLGALMPKSRAPERQLFVRKRLLCMTILKGVLC